MLLTVLFQGVTFLYKFKFVCLCPSSFQVLKVQMVTMATAPLLLQNC